MTDETTEEVVTPEVTETTEEVVAPEVTESAEIAPEATEEVVAE